MSEIITIRIHPDKAWEVLSWAKQGRAEYSFQENQIADGAIAEFEAQLPPDTRYEDVQTLAQIVANKRKRYLRNLSFNRQRREAKEAPIGGEKIVRADDPEYRK